MSKRKLAVFVSVCTLGVAAVGTSLATAGSSSRNASGTHAAAAAGYSVTLGVHQTVIYIPIVFNTPFEVHRIDVTMNAPGTVEAASQDCCIADDHWTTQAIDISAGNPPLGAVPTTSYAVGNGRIDVFSGSTTLNSVSHVRVIVTYATGVDVFPAGMTERIEAPPGSTVTVES